MKDADTPTSETSTAKPAAKPETLLFRVVKVPAGKKCLRVKIGDNGWRWYPGHKPRLTRKQADKVNELCDGALELIPEL